MAPPAPPASQPESAVPAPAPSAPATAPGRPPLLASEDLFQGSRVVEIAHNGEVYRLQATRLGKLILTK
ncbi:MAG TPA: hemin uptake protein HemP [Ramlibacter sp.]|nr:hemin uptake protein HemP [Ramlibacter sp.]